MVKTNFNHFRPVAQYVVSGSNKFTDSANYIVQPPYGNDNNAKVFYSYFLPVIASDVNITDPVAFFILKPRNLWLQLDGTSLRDTYGNGIDNIVNYSPKYVVGKPVNLRYLVKPLIVSDFLQKQGITIPKESTIKEDTKILAEDSNEINRTRIAAPNTSIVTQPVNYTVFSRWL